MIIEKRDLAETWEVIFFVDVPNAVAQMVIVSDKCAEHAITKVRRQHRGEKLIVVSAVNTAVVRTYLNMTIND